MGAFIDKFEGIVLNSARRVLSAGVLLLVLGLAWNFLAGTSNVMDGPNLDSDDRYDMPEYIEPLPEDTKKSSDSEEENDDTKDKIDPIERDYRKELDNIASSYAPLYISLKSWEVDTAFTDIRKYIKGEIAGEIYSSNLNSKQRDDWVDGFEDYADDFSDYMVDKHDINFKKPVSRTLENMSSVENGMLNYPLSDYKRRANNLYSTHMSAVAEANSTASQNNQKGEQQLMNAVYAIAIIISLILMLLFFKAENSLRRSADSIEQK